MGQANDKNKPMDNPFDLSSYFGRIHYDGITGTSLETLAAIHQRHAETIPFENLDPFLRRPVLLDIESLQRKLLRSGRGGYCFEHNLLLGAALRTLGFDVTNLAARVQWNAPGNYIGPRSHMLLLIQLNGKSWIADVGFGGQTLTGPVRLEANIEQGTPHGRFRLLDGGDHFVMQALIGPAEAGPPLVNGGWRPLYRFDLHPQYLPDYEVSNWYLSNHPNSHFVTGLTAARPAEGRRYALRNNQFSVYYLDGASQHKVLTTAEELRTVLEDVFHINLPDAPNLDAALSRLTAAVAEPAPTGL
jgi:N-hydroxyarylamine O-acetyltransferase